MDTPIRRHFSSLSTTRMSHDMAEMTRRMDDMRVVSDAHMFRGNAQMALGRFPAALESFRANLALCREIGGGADDGRAWVASAPSRRPRRTMRSLSALRTDFR